MFTRRKLLAALTVLAAAGCSGSAMSGNDPSPAGQLTIGFLAPQTGPLAAIGADMLAGWQLYLDQHGGKLGGHTIRVVVAEEGDGGATARASVDRLLSVDNAVAVVGAATAPAVASAAVPTREHKVPFVGVGGRPSTVTDVAFMWHTSFDSRDYGAAVGSHIAGEAGGTVWVVGPDYQGGYDQLNGFVTAFTGAGGRLANPGGKPTYTPYPATANFSPWLAQIKASKPAAVYAFYAGAQAVEFVRQYQQFGLHATIPLYGPAFLTEGAPVLKGQADAADGIHTVANYAADLPGQTNTAFTKALTAKGITHPTVYHMTSYDAAALLDQAIAAAGPTPTPEAINTAIGLLSTIDSPRGSWRFNTAHTPVQTWYLRKVTTTDGVRTNTVIKTLATVGN